MPKKKRVKRIGVSWTNKRKMPQEKKRKTECFNSTKESLAIISAFHNEEKRRKQIENDATLSEKEKEKAFEEVKRRKAELGGIETYQAASIYGAKRYKCNAWVMPLMRTHLKTGSAFLDVGAIDHQYANIKDFTVIPIDLNPQHKDVIKYDFFEFAHDMILKGELPERVIERNNRHERIKVFDAVILSLVINFVGDPRARGNMIALSAHKRILRKGGLLFITLPLACLENSRYMNATRFRKLVCALGFEVVVETCTLKLYRGAFRSISPFENYNTSTRTFKFETEYPRKHLRKDKVKRNNFCVMLKNSN